MLRRLGGDCATDAMIGSMSTTESHTTSPILTCGALAGNTLGMDPDAVAADHNNDGHMDEVSVDLNHDGITDVTYTDTNFDGHADQVAYDTNGDGVADRINIDDNFDGRVDVQHQDTDGDGHIDTILVDQDHDGYADGMFTNADGDGMIDDFTAGHSDNMAPMIDDFGVEADDLHQVGHDDLHDGGDTIGV